MKAILLCLMMLVSGFANAQLSVTEQMQLQQAAKSAAISTAIVGTVVVVGSVAVVAATSSVMIGSVGVVGVAAGTLVVAGSACIISSASEEMKRLNSGRTLFGYSF